MLLTFDEARVLGCLVEKERTTPQQYPLSEYAVVLACNQTTNRDPVVTCDVSTVRIALRRLREQGLARTVHRAGERAEKHRHLLVESLGLGDHELAVLALLLLRGPELAGFDDVGAVVHVLERLAEHPDGPLVRRLDREPGRKESRWSDAISERAERADAREEPAEGVDATRGETLVDQVAALRDEVAALRAEVARLRDR